MSLDDIAQELEKEASFKNIDIFIDNTALKHNFIPVINGIGRVGAIGQYLENKKIKTGFFLLNDKIVRYGINEGFRIDQLYDSFKNTLFTEISKEKFFEIMLHK